MLQIEIFSDIVCPWCFIGKRRLDAALSGALGEGVNLRWRPYQLHPRIPVEGMDRGEYLARRYGEDAERGRVPERIRVEAEAEGIDMRFDLMERLPNTLQAHRLMEYAYEHDSQHALSEALFVGYFCQGRDVGDLQTLVEIAGEVGMSGEDVEAYLNSDAGSSEVQSQLQRAPEIGVSGVPGYYLANGFLLPGAQTSETMGQIISRVKDKLAKAAAHGA